jgi:hypothetical protein
MYFDFGFNWGGIGRDPILALDPLFYANYKAKRINAYSKNGSGVPTINTADRSGGDHATRIFKGGNDGIETITASDTNRFVSGHYDSTGYHSGIGLLIERDAANEVKEQDGSDIAVGNDATKTLAQDSPMGAVATKITFDDTGGDATADTDTISNLTATEEVFVSFLVKKGTKASLGLSFTDGFSPALLDTVIDEYATASLGEWIKVERSFTMNAETAGYLSFNLEGGAVDTGEITVCGISVSVIPYPSIIPSTGGRMQRNEEVLVYSAEDNFKLEGGTIAIAFRPNMLPTETVEDAKTFLSIAGAGLDLISFGYGVAGEDLIKVVTNRDPSFDFPTATYAPGWADRNELHTIAIQYVGGIKFNLWGDGVNRGESNLIFAALTMTNLSMTLSSGLNTNIKSIVTFDRRFSDAEMVELDRLMRL